MPDKGRDLKISILSDADQFDLGKPADQLDQLADAADQADSKLSQLGDAGDQLASVGQDAERAGSELKGLGKDADKAGADVKGLAKDATATAAKVDGAFDKIAAASKRSSSTVNKEMDEAGKGLDEFKDESAGTAREAAASFTGSFDDVAGTIQEVMANAFAGFGPIGMAGGIAAAAGIGFLVTSITEAREKVKELAAGLLDLKLDPEMDTASGRIQQVLDTLKDSGDLSRFKTEARDAGVEWTDFVRALSGDQDALDRVRAQLAANTDGLGGLEELTTSAGRASADLSNRLNDQAEANAQATDSADAYQQAVVKLGPDVDTTSEAVKGLTEALEGFTDPADVYRTLVSDATNAERERAAAVAKGTKDSKDSWEDYAKSVDVSVTDYIGALERQVVAQEQWSSNLAKLARRGVSEGTLAELEKLGPEGAPLVAKLTTASDAELSKLVALMRRKGADSGQQLAAGLASRGTAVAGEVSEIKEDARRRLAGGVTLPVRVSPPPAGQASAIRRDVQNNMRPVEIPVMLRNVPSSVMSRYVP